MRRLEREQAASGKYSKADAGIRATLAALDALRNAERVAGYIPMGGEVDLTPLLANLAETGAIVTLPRSTGESKEGDGTRIPRPPPLAYVMAEADAEMLRGWSMNDAMPRGVFGIPEPPRTARVVPNREVDVWLVPALAFDERGNRLGRGGGFYDRFLAENAGLKIGVGHEYMILDELPCDDWDQRMDLIVTERRLLWIYGQK
ncbi:MAG: 5-formyltetrahydrofolate cyclo-ligase [Kiritimatiellaeota bacterium]|nr:5-formyltetrahydrofolate cyclo-ligase [Kiritimatiellota bacterium]